MVRARRRLLRGALTASGEGALSTTVMANRCEVCGKGPTFGNNISHAHNVSSRRFNPNLQTVRALVNGAAKRLKVCTRCIRSGKITKAA